MPEHTTLVKRCCVCQIEKPLAEFNKDKQRSDGHAPRCRECNQSYMAAWRNSHRNAYNDYFRLYFKNYPDHAIHVRQWQVENRSKRNEQARQKYRDKTFRDKYLARKSAWKRANPDKASAIAQRTRIKHTLERRTYEAKRRARISLSTQHFSKDDVLSLYSTQDGLCQYCGESLNGRYHVDHVMPLSRGGSNGRENIVLACQRCNDSKHNHTVSEWLAAIKTRNPHLWAQVHGWLSDNQTSQSE